eukprot:TRINITY_DN22200_c0_g1_i1.p1 TRINITY_DN22200_c0_g1~~TRINITY_DN22200_c0_g1_i1.p1  ORF type:complete len:711 (+),score=101.73 TRINITY_DN22200_c0_g1_i1:274-2406(+)
MEPVFPARSTHALHRHITATHRHYLFFPTIVCLALSVVAGPSAAEVDIDIHLDAAGLSLFHADVDPLGLIDSFAALSERDKKRWGHFEDAGTDAKTKSLAGLTTTVSIEIRLVGFDGEGNHGMSVKEGDLLKYTDALKFDDRVQVIHGDTHEVAVKTQVALHVTKAPQTLSMAITGEVERALRKIPPSGGPGPAIIPHAGVEALVKSDAKSESFKRGFVVYLMNPKKQSLPYLYSYDTVPGGCPGSLFAPTEGHYLWVDLTAGPVSYGPSGHGEGLVTNMSFPRVASFAREQQHKVFMAHLVALVANAVQFLLSPAIYHHPVPFMAHTEVLLIHVHESAREGEVAGVSLAAIKEAITGSTGGVQPLLLPGQTVLFKTHKLLMEKCPLCAAAYARALRGRSAKTLPTGQVLAVKEHLDSETMHHLLAEFWYDIKAAAGVEDAPFFKEDVYSTKGGRVIPMFLFDMDTTEPVLLDGGEQAVAYDDMVVAVRTQAKTVRQPFQCHGEPVEADLRQVTRPLLAALLQTGWGVTPSHLTWSPQHNRTVEDYRWAVGATPFGAFSKGVTITAAERSAALRNVLLSRLNDTAANTLLTLQAIKAYGGEAVIFRSGRPRVEYSQRWNVLKHKLGRACEALSLLNYPRALYYVRSARHDELQFNILAKTAVLELHSSFSCYKDPPTQWLWYVSMLVVGAGVGWAWTNRDKILRVKHKRF